MKIKILLFLSLMVLGVSVPAAMADFKFEGVAKCKTCHKKKKDGNQYSKWQKGSHAKAFKVLKSAEAKQLAAKVGVSGDPQKAKECLICHTPSQYDAKGQKRAAGMFGKKYKAAEGVQCEDCHGAGEKYYKKKTMKKITKEGGVAKSATAKKTGLITPNEKVCKQCHVAQTSIGGVTYQNPSFKDFNFDKMYKKIAHPKP